MSLGYLNFFIGLAFLLIVGLIGDILRESANS